MLNRITTAITTDRHAAAAAAIITALIVCFIAGVALIIAGVPHAASAEQPCVVTTSPGVPCPRVIILGTATPAPPVVAAFAAPGGPQLGDVPADLPIRYRDSRFPGWVGVDWDGGVVWFLADGDASGLADLAPPPTATAAPALAAQPVPQQQTIYVEQPQAAPPTADLCTAETCDPAAAPTVCAANACWSAAAPDVVYVPAFGERGQRAAEPQPGDPGFAESFRDPQDVAFDASFRDPGCSRFIGYLPGDPCYRAP